MAAASRDLGGVSSLSSCGSLTHVSLLPSNDHPVYVCIVCACK